MSGENGPVSSTENSSLGLAVEVFGAGSGLLVEYLAATTGAAGIIGERHDLGVVDEAVDFVDVQELVFAEPFQLEFEPSGPMGCGEAGDPAGRGVEQDRVAGMDCLNPETDREMGFPNTGRPEQYDIICLRDPCRRAEVRQDVAAQRGLVVAAKLLQRFHLQEVGTANALRRAMCFSIDDLALQHYREVFLVRPPGLPGRTGEPFPGAGGRECL